MSCTWSHSNDPSFMEYTHHLRSPHDSIHLLGLNFPAMDSAPPPDARQKVVEQLHPHPRKVTYVNLESSVPAVIFGFWHLGGLKCHLSCPAEIRPNQTKPAHPKLWSPDR